MCLGMIPASLTSVYTQTLLLRLPRQHNAGQAVAQVEDSTGIQHLAWVPRFQGNRDTRGELS
jgi:hypothetical protein